MLYTVRAASVCRYYSPDAGNDSSAQRFNQTDRPIYIHTHTHTHTHTHMYMTRIIYFVCLIITAIGRRRRRCNRVI
jgi:hypothetical protein